MIDSLTDMVHLYIIYTESKTISFYKTKTNQSIINLIPFQNLSLECFKNSIIGIDNAFSNRCYEDFPELLEGEDGNSVVTYERINGRIIKNRRNHPYTLYTEDSLNVNKITAKDRIRVMRDRIRYEAELQKIKKENHYVGIYKKKTTTKRDSQIKVPDFFDYFFEDYLDICPSHITLYTCAFPITALRATIAKISENIPWCVIEVVPTEELSEADKKEVESYGDFVYVLPPVPIKDYNPEIFERYYKDYVRFLKSMTKEQEEEYLKLVKEDCCPECGSPVTLNDKTCKYCGCPIN